MRFGNDAIAWARNRLGSHAYDGLCERFVRSAYGFGPDYGSAKQAWNAAGAKHAGETSPPPAPSTPVRRVLRRPCPCSGI